MSHDRCYDHKCRACSKCAESESVEPTVIAPEVLASIKERAQKLSDAGWPGDANGILELLGDIEARSREVERLHVVVDQEARARQAAESEVARLNSYIANGVGGAS